MGKKKTLLEKKKEKDLKKVIYHVIGQRQTEKRNPFILAATAQTLSLHLPREQTFQAGFKSGCKRIHAPFNVVFILPYRPHPASINRPHFNNALALQHFTTNTP